MNDGPSTSPVPPVPPGSTANRELLGAITEALDIPAPATVADETTYLRLSRDRARVVLVMLASASRNSDDADVMAIAAAIREQLADYPADTYDHHGLTS